MERQEIGGATLRPEVAAKVAEHYEHARRKHPHFADGLFLDEKKSLESAKRRLAVMRMIIEVERSERTVCAETLLECEIAEVCCAFGSGDKAHAVEEIYDAIAVLLRMADVIEGRQALGRPRREHESEKEVIR